MSLYFKDHKSFELEAVKFLNQLEKQMSYFDVPLQGHWDIDHICFRCATLDDYQTYKQLLLGFSDLMGEVKVSGRYICTFRLRQGIWFLGRRIDLIELPQPKPSKLYPTGFEHIEIVADSSLKSMVSDFPKLNWSQKGMLKAYNPELALKLESGSLKYHNQSLLSVCTLEENHKVFDILLSVKVLEFLSSFDPRVAGTFPLGIANANSDLDIVYSHGDLSGLSTSLEDQFGQLENFSQNLGLVAGVPSLVTSFSVDAVKFELFGQGLDVAEQNAYRHFKVEEILLKYLPENFKKNIILQRNNGSKTEKAFCNVLGIQGDAFMEMRGLSFLGIDELLERFSDLSF